MFNIKERKGILVVIFILMTIAVTVSMRKWSFSGQTPKILSGEEIATIELLKLKNQQYKSNFKNYNNYTAANSYKYGRDLYNENDTKSYKLSEFDPNTVSESKLKEMGINDKAISNWIKYRNNGGKFFKKEDIQKIYGIKPYMYEMLVPYAVIKPLPKPVTKPDTIYSKRKDYSDNFPNKEKLIIDINTCSDLELMELKGIGEKLSARIIKYRDRLGGYVRIEQLQEVYGLPPETYENIKNQIIADPRMINKLRINLADAYVLYSFPYIPKREAYQIVNYRKQHGNFHNIDDLKKIQSLNLEFIQKIEPYLDFGE
jgi:competence protein ComEA